MNEEDGVEDQCPLKQDWDRILLVVFEAESIDPDAHDTIIAELSADPEVVEELMQGRPFEVQSDKPGELSDELVLALV